MPENETIGDFLIMHNSRKWKEDAWNIYVKETDQYVYSAGSREGARKYCQTHFWTGEKVVSHDEEYTEPLGDFFILLAADEDPAAPFEIRAGLDNKFVCRKSTLASARAYCKEYYYVYRLKIPRPKCDRIAGEVCPTPSTPVKLDESKTRLDLLPTQELEVVGQVFTFGANKYAEYNYLTGDGLKLSRVFGALLRHVFAWWRKEELDQETGLPHLAHAAACILMLMQIQRHRPKADDRPTRDAEF